MLSVASMAGGQGNYYTNLAREDYYLEGGEPLGRWCGSGAHALGLSGEVQPAQLRSLLAGVSPEGRPLIQNAGARGKGGHQPGWDLTFSAPKSVSVLWSQADEPTRRTIQGAHHDAVKTALAYLEEEAVFTRRGQGGRVLERCGLVVATFEHGTSRALDPQLHTHALVMNVATRADGTTGTILSKPLYQHKMTAGALYRADLAARLSRELGVTCELDGNSFRVWGVPESLCELYSKRRAQIEEKLGAKGLESAAAAAVATLDTRKTKTVVPPRSELFTAWRDEGARHGFGLTGIIGRRNRQPLRAEDLRELIARALDAITTTESHFSRRDLLRVVATAAQARGVDAVQVRAAVSEALSHSPEIVRLGTLKKEDRYTTRAVIRLEEKMIEAADELANRRGRGVPRDLVESVISRYSARRSEVLEELKHHAKQLLRAAKGQATGGVDRDRLRAEASAVLSEEQAQAVRHLTGEGAGSIRILEGWAGTGKTTTLRAAREAWERAGYEVVGVTVAGKARKELEKGAGITSYTYALLDLMTHPGLGDMAKHHVRQLWRAAQGKPTYRYDPFKLKKGHVLVVDEAGMMSTPQLARLVEDVRKAGATLVLVGDRKQLPAIQTGGGFSYLADRFGKAELATIIRQRDARDRQAVRDIATGKAAKALRSFAERGLVTVADDRDEAISALVADWANHERGRASASLIFVGTRRDAHEINTRCQKERLRGRGTDAAERATVRARGVFDEKSTEKVAFDLHRGDRVLFTKISRVLGVENGDTGTILAVRKRPWPVGDTLHVRLDSGQTVFIPLRSYSDVRLGYAVTTHKGQGTTVDRAYVLAGGRMTDKELSYVQASRAREVVRIYTDQLEAGPEIKRLAAQMSKSREKTLAHEVKLRAAPDEIPPPVTEKESQGLRLRL